MNDLPVGGRIYREGNRGEVEVGLKFIRKASHLEKKTSKAPEQKTEYGSIRWSPSQIGKESHCHPTFHRVPRTIFGSSG